MKISKVIEFLQKVEEKEGDLELDLVTGFWVRNIPRTGERVVAVAIGDGMDIRYLKDHVKAPLQGL